VTFLILLANSPSIHDDIISYICTFCGTKVVSLPKTFLAEHVRFEVIKTYFSCATFSSC